MTDQVTEIMRTEGPRHVERRWRRAETARRDLLKVSGKARDPMAELGGLIWQRQKGGAGPPPAYDGERAECECGVEITGRIPQGTSGISSTWRSRTG